MKVHHLLREFGLRKNPDRPRRPHGRFEANILEVFDNNPTESCRNAAKQLRARNIPVSKDVVHRTLRKNGRRPYHLQPVQYLMQEDGPRRREYCSWLLRSIQIDHLFLRKILFTDEATFTRRGVVNFHNLHVWGNVNPHQVRPRTFQQEFSVNVWIGVIGNHLIGPHFLPPRLNSHLFLQFLENDLGNYLEDVPLNVRQQMWFQMDGAPAHYGVNVRRWCDLHFRERWIGRVNNAHNHDYVPGTGPAAWPPRSPDLTVLDFFIWGFLKDKVYSTPVHTELELVGRIEAACEILRNNPHQISAAVNSTRRRCQICIESDGFHFEQLL